MVNNKPHILKRANMSGADYLFHETAYSKYDIADKTLSCGRRPDGLKLWLYLQKHGVEGLNKIANDALDKSIYMVERIRQQPDKFEMVNDPQGTNVCFWYIPPAFRGKEYTDE